MSLKKLTARRLTPEESKTLITTLVSSIVERCKPLRVILFGSGARNELTDASDIDLLVITQSTQETKQSRRAYYSQKPALEWPADILFLSEEEFEKRSHIGGVCMIAKDEGVVVYQKEAS